MLNPSNFLANTQQAAHRQPVLGAPLAGEEDADASPEQSAAGGFAATQELHGKKTLAG